MIKLNYLLLGLCALRFLGYRTAASGVKSEDGQMSQEEFVDACKKRLSDPNEGVAVGLMLKSFAGAKDCNEAYQKVKAIVAKTKG